MSWDDVTTIPALQGITAQAPVLGSGTVRWSFTDDNHKLHTIETFAYYVPSAKVRLLIPQRVLRQYQQGAFVLKPNSTQFYFDSKSPLTFSRLDKQEIGLPIASLHRRRSTHTWLDAAHLGADILAPSNQNLSPTQKELLVWHYKLAHFNLPWVQSLARPRKNDKDSSPLIPTRNPKVSSVSTSDLKCEACQLGKAHKRPNDVHLDQIRPERDGGLQREVLRVGSRVATDQFVSSVRGRRFDTKGKEPDSQKFVGGTIFVDISSGFIQAFPQTSLCASETVLRKKRFERNLSNFGHTIHHYLGDNGVYRSKEFQDEIKICGQTMDFCGVGAHHQNGVAERAIRTVSESARTMMLHAAIHWSGAVDINLWPMAAEYAVHVYNLLPNIQSNTAPLELITGSRLSPGEVRNCRVWGCPAYVLDPKVQDGNKLPRWVPKARRGQFLG